MVAFTGPTFVLTLQLNREAFQSPKIQRIYALASSPLVFLDHSHLNSKT